MSEQQKNENKHIQILQPPEWARPRGYSPGMAASGRLVFISGQVGWDEHCHFQTTDFVAQVRQTLRNILTVLAQADARPEHIVRLTWYVLDKREYLECSKELGAVYRSLMGQHYPAMAVVQVTALIEDQARVEIEATAVIP
ncbi:MAG TPA: RidA family protein [Ktedonobacteraceae bacterium]